MRVFSIVWLVTMIGAATITQGSAEQKTIVGVKFVLDEHSYRKHFLRDIALLEREATARIVKKLREHIGFLDFAPMPPEPLFKLTVRLDAKEPPERPGAAREVGFHIILEGPKVTQESDYVIFRAEQDFGTALGTVDSLLTEIGAKLRDQVYKNRIGKLLNQIPIARSGHVWRTSPPVGWVLPYQQKDLCMEFESQLEIENVVPSATGPMPLKLEALASHPFQPLTPTAEHLRGNIFGKATDPSKFQSELGAASQISVSAVYVKEYRHLVSCPTDFR